MWFFDIFGYASQGKRLIKLSEEGALRARGLLSLRFFDKHPEYAWLKMHITKAATPELYENMDLVERSSAIQCFPGSIFFCQCARPRIADSRDSGCSSGVVR